MLGSRRIGKVCVALWGKWWLQKLKLTKQVTADKEGAGPPLKERPEDSTSCLRTLKLTDTLEGAQDAQRLHHMGKRQSHMTTNAERESERSLGEPRREKQG